MRSATKRGLAGVGAIAVVAAGVGIASAQNSDDTSYRTVEAAVADVTSTVDLTGTVAHPSTADTVFETSGTVADVYVAVGDQVAAGQKLASLETSSLDSAVTKAESDLASAKARLVSDQAALADAAEQEAEAKAQAAAQEKATKAAAAAQQKAQQELRQAQQQAEQSLASANQTLADAQQACAGSDAAACSVALQKVQQAQQAVSQAQASYAKALGSSGQSSPSGSSSSLSSNSQGSSSGNGQSGSLGGGASVTEATISSDKAQIADAEAALLEAQQARAHAVVEAPVAGTVAEVSVAPGDSAAAGTPAVTVIGDGVTTVELSVSSTKVASIKSGQSATVTVPGVADPLTGTVTNVGLLPDTTSGSATYPVTVTLDGGSDLATGVTANVEIQTGSASQVVTVPVSAVSGGVVQVLDGDKVTRKTVTVGVVGETRAQVDGIEAGTEVVIADLGADLPSNNTNQRGLNGFGGPGGGTVTFGGGGAQFTRQFSRG